MRVATLAVVLLLAAVPGSLSAQSADSSSRGTKPDSTPSAPGTCVDRNRDRKCDKPEKKGDRTVRKVGEIVAPTVKDNISTEKGGTRGTRRGSGVPRPPLP